MAAAYVKSGGPDGARNPSRFIDYLGTCYGNPNLKKKALGRLGGIIQGDEESFAAFLPKFERELVDSGGANIDNMRRHKKSRTPPYIPPFDHTATKSRNQPPVAEPAVDNMDWEPTRISQAIHKANEKLKGKRAKWVDQAEIDRRKSEGRCLRCGRTGCRVNKRPLLPARRPELSNKTKVARFRPVLKAEVEDEEKGLGQSLSEQSEDESAKEWPLAEVVVRGIQKPKKHGRRWRQIWMDAITVVVYADTDIDRHKRKRVFFYVIPDQTDDWAQVLPVANLAIRNRDAASTGIGPFFATQGYNVDLLGLTETDKTIEDDGPVTNRSWRSVYSKATGSDRSSPSGNGLSTGTPRRVRQ
ncbi:hypothetical protein B0H66DRAFT_609858 [Apodospora peruviana]|uniref:Uncharacterized protein n=1 Tax=Apodospora peruviana TaxID=516989 RepID=A0AAE0IQ81_9PEZI|nr:hypothetical protein B0H66DRAFT_609858 [Apodospora peruviana]